MKTIVMITTAALIGMFGLGFVPVASAGTSCQVTGNGSCTFTCLAGESVHVSTHGIESVTGTCGTSSAACASSGGACMGFGVMSLTDGTGTCVATGTGLATCAAA